jgi:hypothetical protein
MTAHHHVVAVTVTDGVAGSSSAGVLAGNANCLPLWYRNSEADDQQARFELPAPHSGSANETSRHPAAVNDGVSLTESGGDHDPAFGRSGVMCTDKRNLWKIQLVKLQVLATGLLCGRTFIFYQRARLIDQPSVHQNLKSA